MNLLTTQQAAESLSITDSAVRMAIRAGKLKPVRVGARGLLIAPEEIERYRRNTSRRARTLKQKEG